MPQQPQQPLQQLRQMPVRNLLTPVLLAVRHPKAVRLCPIPPPGSSNAGECAGGVEWAEEDPALEEAGDGVAGMDAAVGGNSNPTGMTMIKDLAGKNNSAAKPRPNSKPSPQRHGAAEKSKNKTSTTKATEEKRRTRRNTGNDRDKKN
jgi:hypothetical protein